jgi:hypothetical protein
MSKRMPGVWEPPTSKPEEFSVNASKSAIDRIRDATPEMAFQIAADRAQAAGLAYGDSGVVQVPGRGGGASFGGQGGAPSRTIQANFDNITDDYQYRVAQALYNAGDPDARIDLPDGTQAELYTNDLAILYVMAGRSLDHVDIHTFRSVRGLDGAWEDLLFEAGY